MNHEFNLDQIIQKLLKPNIKNIKLKEEEIRFLCLRAKDIFLQE